MGILSDPSLTQKNYIGKKLVKYNWKICSFLYIAGVIWFFCLGHSDFNNQTYLSENALSPGLVYSEMKIDSMRFARSMMQELNAEREKHINDIPIAWLLAKMTQIGLESYTHNFTLDFPLGKGKKFHGTNVYGILRAPRIASTEGIVFSAPYRPPSSIHSDISASIPILLAFAEFARKKNYWAKDLIFVFTDQEQLGMHAWLDAYHQDSLNYYSGLKSGNLEARSGSLQAALNLEMQSLDIDYINIKLEGLNGQLPNLDLFNVVQRLAGRETIDCGYNYSPIQGRGLQNSMRNYLKNIISMILPLANGVPTGNHGFFLRYRIESLTLEGIKSPVKLRKTSSDVLSVLKLIEGTTRSINNLLERFHQSYFFYLLASNERFLSISNYMPSLIFMIAPLFIKAFLIWLSMFNEEDEEYEIDDMKSRKDIEQPYFRIGVLFGVAHLIGFFAYSVPLNQTVNKILSSYGLATEAIIVSILTTIALVVLLAPSFVRLDNDGLKLLHVALLLEIGTALLCVGLLNFSLGFVITVIASPILIFVNTEHSIILRCWTAFYVFFLHPLVMSYISVLILTCITFKELQLSQILLKSVLATVNALTFCATDCIIYGNWLFSLITVVILPCWSLLWLLCLIPGRKDKEKLKTE